MILVFRERPQVIYASFRNPEEIRPSSFDSKGPPLRQFLDLVDQK